MSITSILDNYALNNGFLYDCDIDYVRAYDLQLVLNSCDNPDNGGGSNPTNPANCSQKTKEQAQLEVQSALASFQTQNEIKLQPPSTEQVWDEATGEYYLKESPTWQFFSCTLPLNYQLSYTLHFKSERYTLRTPKRWRAFTYESPVPGIISASSGTVPPCAAIEVEVKSVTCNIAPDKLTATAAVRYRSTVKIACVFGWEVGVHSNENESEPLTQVFPAARNY